MLYETKLLGSLPTMRSAFVEHTRQEECDVANPSVRAGISRASASFASRTLFKAAEVFVALCAASSIGAALAVGV